MIGLMELVRLYKAMFGLYTFEKNSVEYLGALLLSIVVGVFCSAIGFICFVVIMRVLLRVVL